jgi:hypothetical protein
MSRLVQQVRNAIFDMPFMKHQMAWHQTDTTSDLQSQSTPAETARFTEYDQDAASVQTSMEDTPSGVGAFIECDAFASLTVPSSDLPAFHRALQLLQRASQQKATVDLLLFAAVFRIKRILSSEDYARFTFALTSQVDPALTPPRVSQKLSSYSSLLHIVDASVDTERFIETLCGNVDRSVVMPTHMVRLSIRSLDLAEQLDRKSADGMLTELRSRLHTILHAKAEQKAILLQPESRRSRRPAEQEGVKNMQRGAVAPSTPPTVAVRESRAPRSEASSRATLFTAPLVQPSLAASSSPPPPLEPVPVRRQRASSAAQLSRERAPLKKRSRTQRAGEEPAPVAALTQVVAASSARAKAPRIQPSVPYMMSAASVQKFRTALGLVKEIWQEQKEIAERVRVASAAEESEDGSDEERMEDVDDRKLAPVPILPRPMEVEDPGTKAFFEKYQYALLRASTWSRAERKRLDEFVKDVRALIEGLADPDPDEEPNATISGGVMQRNLKDLREVEWAAIQQRWRDTVQSAAERIGIPFSLLRLISPKALVAVPGFGEQLIHVSREQEQQISSESDSQDDAEAFVLCLSFCSSILRARTNHSRDGIVSAASCT